MAKIELKNIIKGFDGEHVILRDVSLVVEDGEFLTLVGPSGCGKSTLLRIIAGLERQEKGSVWIANRCVDDLPPKQRDVAMVFQSYALYPHLTVEENIAVPLRMRYLSWWQRLPLLSNMLPGARRLRRQIRARVAEVATTLHITKLLNRRPSQLSGGQRQRVALGRAMVRTPQLYLMDEPLSNLDTALRTQMRAELVSLHKSLGGTFIYVTHDQIEAMTMSSRVAVMKNGEILQIGAPREIYENPNSLDVAEFMSGGVLNRLSGRIVENDVWESQFGLLRLPRDAVSLSTTAVCFRPEQITLLDNEPDTSLSGYVTFVEYLGSEAFLHLRSRNSSDRLVLRLALDRVTHFREDDLVHFHISQMLLFDADGHRIPQTDQPTSGCETHLQPEKFLDFA